MLTLCQGTYAVNSLILGWCGSVCGQTKEKKAVAIGIVTTFMNVSFIWTPYLWMADSAPRFVPAMASSCAFSLATAGVAWIVKIIMKRRNKKMRNSEDETGNFYVY